MALGVAARRAEEPERRVFAAGVAAAVAAALALAIQTDVIGDPWMAYMLWSLAGLTLARERVAEIRPAATPERAWDGRASEARTASMRRRQGGASHQAVV